MSSHYKRSSSPGSRRITNGGRTSSSSIGASYDPYSSSSYSKYSRDPYSSKSGGSGGAGVIPISTETYVNYPSSRAGETYTDRPRRSTLDSEDRPNLSVRSRPTALVQGSSNPRPSSPLSRSFDPGSGFVKPASTTKREHKRLYSIDDGTGTARLIAETSTDPRHDDRDRDRRERRGYHLTGRSGRREVDDSEYSYTDPKGMYETTEPSWRLRSRGAGSDGRRLKARPSSMLDQYQSYSPPERSSTGRLEATSSKSRGLDRPDDYNLARTTTFPEPMTASRDDRSGRGGYDGYRQDKYNSRSAAVIHQDRQSARGDDRDYYRDDYRRMDDHRDARHDEYRNERRDSRDDRYDDRRTSRYPQDDNFRDERVGDRGFGIHVPSPRRDGYGSSSNESLSLKRPPTNGPIDIPPAGMMPGQYDPLPVREPERNYSRDGQGYPPSRDDSRWVNRDDRGPPSAPREDGRKYSTDDRPYYPPPPREEGSRRSPPARDYDREYDRPRDRAQDRDLDRDRDRDEGQRRPRGGSGSGSSILPGAAATAAAVAGAVAVEERKRDKRADDEQDHRHGTRRAEPNDREDAAERHYAQRDAARDARRDQDRDRRRDDQPRQSPPLDPDEEYRRRIQAAQLELSRSNARDDAGRDDQRLRHKDQRLDQSSRNNSHDARNGDPSEDQHNRFVGPSASSNNITDRAMVAEPSEIDSARIPGGYPRDPAIQITDITAGALVPRRSSTPNSPSPDRRDTRVRIVEPAKEATPPPAAPKSILRKPTERFPEDPNPIREGVAPLKDAKVAALMKERGIPSGAKWTKIDRKLVNPQALEEKGERFEERLDCVIVLRVLAKEDIQALADRTREIRDEREARHEREHRHRRHHHEESRRGGRHKEDEPATDDDADVAASGGRQKPLMIEG